MRRTDDGENQSKTVTSQESWISKQTENQVAILNLPQFDMYSNLNVKIREAESVGTSALR